MNEQRLVQLPPLDVGAINLILTGLGELPLKVSKPLFDAIQAEAEKQLQPAEPDTTPHVLSDDALMDLAREECENFRWPSTALSIMRKAIAAGGQTPAPDTK